MKTYACLWYLAELCLEWKMFQKEVVEKTKNTHLMSNNVFFFFVNRAVWDNVEKYGEAREVTSDNIIRRMCFACWISKATKTLSAYVILNAFPRRQWLGDLTSILRWLHSGDQVKKTEMGRTCGTYGGEERCIQGFSGETWGKETTWKTQA
jgi:hypothetical protein